MIIIKSVKSDSTEQYFNAESFRNFIGFELDEKYFNIAKERLEKESGYTNE